jgi:hypothetical protein
MTQVNESIKQVAFMAQSSETADQQLELLRRSSLKSQVNVKNQNGIRINSLNMSAYKVGISASQITNFMKFTPKFYNSLYSQKLAAPSPNSNNEILNIV